MTGRHEAPPLGSLARDATAPPYHGRHRACDHISLKCTLYGGREHLPCSGTCDCGQEHLCECQCHGPYVPARADRVPWSRRFKWEGYDERAERVADERWSDPEDTHQGGPDDV